MNISVYLRTKGCAEDTLLFEYVHTVIPRKREWIGYAVNTYEVVEVIWLSLDGNPKVHIVCKL